MKCFCGKEMTSSANWSQLDLRDYTCDCGWNCDRGESPDAEWWFEWTDSTEKQLYCLYVSHPHFGHLKYDVQEAFMGENMRGLLDLGYTIDCVSRVEQQQTTKRDEVVTDMSLLFAQLGLV